MITTPKLKAKPIAQEVVKTLDIEPIARLKKDLRQAAKDLSVDEVRYLVDTYYSIQDYRMASGNQVVALTKREEPVGLLAWIFLTMEAQEEEIKKWLDIYTDEEPTGMGAWSKAICGIGPVISAGLLAYIDISKINTAGKLWRFAGLDPTMKWEKGQKRPFCAPLKVLCWKLGQSFMKVSGNDKDFYGKLWRQRKDREIAINEAGGFAEQAKAKLERFKIGKDTDAYKAYSAGKLPPAHLDARARRYAVKIFLSHFFDEAYRRHYKQPPPKPFALSHLSHVDMIEPPV